HVDDDEAGEVPHAVDPPVRGPALGDSAREGVDHLADDHAAHPVHAALVLEVAVVVADLATAGEAAAAAARDDVHLDAQLDVDAQAGADGGHAAIEHAHDLLEVGLELTVDADVVHLPGRHRAPVHDALAAGGDVHVEPGHVERACVRGGRAAA